MTPANSGGVGFGATTSTLRFSLSCRNAAVVGPMAAMRTIGDTWPAVGSSMGRSKTLRRMGATNSAAEGAKNTIHHVLGSKSVSQILLNMLKAHALYLMAKFESLHPNLWRNWKSPVSHTLVKTRAPHYRFSKCWAARPYSCRQSSITVFSHSPSQTSLQG
jgi:hypothetical protein